MLRELHIEAVLSILTRPADVTPAAFAALEANTVTLGDLHQHVGRFGSTQPFGRDERGQSTTSLSEPTMTTKAGITASTLKVATVG